MIPDDVNGVFSWLQFT